MGKAKTLTAQEFRRVQDYIATRAHAARNRAMLLLTHLAGMRVGEVAALTWGDVVNAEGRVKDEIRLNADQTKGGHPRIVFLSPKLLAHFHLRDQGATAPKCSSRKPTAVRLEKPFQ